MSQQFAPRTKTILEDIGLRLSAEQLPNGTGKPTLKFYQTARNKIRADMYPNLPNLQQNGLIRADMEYGEFFNILQWIEHVAEPTTPNGSTYSVAHEDFTFFNKKRSDATQLIHRTVIGKDEEGRVYVSILSAKPDDAKVKFYFDHPHLCTIKAIGGTLAISPAELSARSAKAWVVMMTAFMPSIVSAHWVDKAAAAAAVNGGTGGNSGGQGGGYNNRSNNGGGSYGGNGGGAPAAATDDDMPF